MNQSPFLQTHRYGLKSAPLKFVSGLCSSPLTATSMWFYSIFPPVGFSLYNDNPKVQSECAILLLQAQCELHNLSPSLPHHTPTVKAYLHICSFLIPLNWFTPLDFAHSISSSYNTLFFSGKFLQWPFCHCSETSVVSDLPSSKMNTPLWAT